MVRMMLDREINECFEYRMKKNFKYFGEAMKIYDECDCTVGPENIVLASIKPFFSQTFDRFNKSIIEHSICSYLWQMVCNDHIKFSIQETPMCFPDKNIKENDELVKSYITCIKSDQDDYKIIESEFWGGTQGEDGYIRFNKPPIKNITYFPLEVGYCKATQFWYHIIQRLSIARLPYDSNYIIYFELVKPEIYRPIF